MQVDELYPEQARRNYKGFIDGLTKVCEEGALFRGGLANGLKIGAILATASGPLDWMKENLFFFFGPIELNRIVATTCAVVAAGTLSYPFDTVRTRLHTMRPLPNGEMPYKDMLDAFIKIWKYEGAGNKLSNFGCFYSGGQAYFARLWVIAYASQLILDRYRTNNFISEFWQPARYQYTTGIDYDIHDPYTDGFNKMMLTNWMAKGGFAANSQDGKTLMKVL